MTPLDTEKSDGVFFYVHICGRHSGLATTVIPNLIRDLLSKEMLKSVASNHVQHDGIQWMLKQVQHDGIQWMLK